MGRRPGNLSGPKHDVLPSALERSASLELIDQAIARTELRIWVRSIEKEDRDQEYRLLQRLKQLREAKCR
jgi:hypothetical protein